MSSVTESEWDEEQVQLLLAEEKVRALTGPNGEWLPDATAPGADPNDYDTHYRYVASGPHLNWAEKTLLDARDRYREEAGEKANLNGLSWTVDRLDY